LLAAIGVSAVPAQTDWSRPAGSIAPDANNHDVYSETFDLYSALYPATRSIVHKLA
jgi:xylulokinase